MDKSGAKILFCVILTGIVSLSVMARFTAGPLDGNFNKYLMQAERWGIPDDLQKRGIEPLYLDNGNAGWDGQFYYYIANDLFAQKDTPKHIDADAYRYQRIGIPLLSKLFSIFLFQDWVSPFLYYLTNLTLILLGTAAAAYFFTQSGVAPYWILFWSVGLGTQITLLNGLPDGAADALFIMALISCYKKKYFLYSVTAAFACLAREAYIAFPIIFLAGQLFYIDLLADEVASDHPNTIPRRMNKSEGHAVTDYFYFAFPIVVFTAWQVFLRFTFSLTPSEQIAELDFPLWSLYKHFSGGLAGHYPDAPAGLKSYIAAAGIFLFSALIICGVYFAIGIRPFTSLRKGNVFAFSLSLCVLALAALYSSFGHTVLWNFTGYMRAANIFVFFIPFIGALGYRKLGKKVLVFIALLTIFFCLLGWALRVDQPAIRYNFDANCHHLVFERDKSCYERFVWRADELPGNVGVTENGMRTAHSDSNRIQNWISTLLNRESHKSSAKPSLLTYGPYVEAPKGRYRIVVSYSGKGSNLGYLDAVSVSPEGKTETFKKVNLSEGTNVNLDEIVDIPTDIRNLEVRIWFQEGELAVRSLVIERLPKD